MRDVDPAERRHLTAQFDQLVDVGDIAVLEDGLLVGLLPIEWLLASSAEARVVDIEGSGPRDPGAAMAVNEVGEVVGSVSGGCVEAAVCQEAERVLDSGEPRLVRYGVADEEAWSLGLSCGGEIEVFIERLD